MNFERFKPGKDGGIDLRHYHNSNNSIIVQCKRYKDYTTLKPTLEKEIHKVKKLNPTRYIITTTAPLSAVNKQAIMNMFAGFIHTPSDIIGREDLETLLAKFPEVEKRNFKLWLSSVNILQKILYNGTYIGSEFDMEEIKQKISLYVQNESLNLAKNILDKNNYVILSGNPGVGKTTLAKMLVLELVSRDYEFISITSDIREAESCFEQKKSKFFITMIFLVVIF